MSWPLLQPQGSSYWFEFHFRSFMLNPSEAIEKLYWGEPAGPNPSQVSRSVILPLLPGLSLFSFYYPKCAIERWKFWKSNPKGLLKGYVPLSRVICLTVAYYFLCCGFLDVKIAKYMRSWPWDKNYSRLNLSVGEVGWKKEVSLFCMINEYTMQNWPSLAFFLCSKTINSP